MAILNYIKYKNKYIFSYIRLKNKKLNLNNQLD